jgi:hypothetical protein
MNLTDITNNQYIKPVLILLAVYITIIVVIQIRKIYLYRKGESTILVEGIKDATKHAMLTRDVLPNSKVGQEFTMSFWIYVNDFNYQYSKPKHVFHIGDDNANSTTPGVWIYPKDNHMMIRFDTMERKNGVSMNPFVNPAILGERKECDIVDLPVQKWVYITLVFINKTLDIYVNGKLQRSCTSGVLPRDIVGNIHINKWGGFDGKLSNLKYVNRALPAHTIYANYLDGSEHLTWWSKLKSFIPKVKIDIGLDK